MAKRRKFNAARVREGLKRRFSLRFHMTLILMAVVMTGVVASKLLLMAGLTNMGWRFPLVALLAYAMFFVYVRVWLYLVVEPANEPSDDLDADDVADAVENTADVLDTARSNVKGVDLAIDVADNMTAPLRGIGGSSDGSSGGASANDFAGGGGEFGGGGASGSFVDARQGAGLADAAGGSGGSSGGGDSGSGFSLPGVDLDVDGDALPLVLVGIALALLAAVILGVGAFFIYQAPVILLEAAIEFLLSAGLLRATRKMKREGWISSVGRATFWPFALIFALSLGAGWLAADLCPGATKVGEVVEYCTDPAADRSDSESDENDSQTQPAGVN